jgi:hypothetical protein
MSRSGSEVPRGFAGRDPAAEWNLPAVGTLSPYKGHVGAACMELVVSPISCGAPLLHQGLFWLMSASIGLPAKSVTGPNCLRGPNWLREDSEGTDLPVREVATAGGTSRVTLLR